jgi:hypothetical protein
MPLLAPAHATARNPRLLIDLGTIDSFEREHDLMDDSQRAKEGECLGHPGPSAPRLASASWLGLAQRPHWAVGILGQHHPTERPVPEGAPADLPRLRVK